MPSRRDTPTRRNPGIVSGHDGPFDLMGSTGRTLLDCSTAARASNDVQTPLLIPSTSLAMVLWDLSVLQNTQIDYSLITANDYYHAKILPCDGPSYYIEFKITIILFIFFKPNLLKAFILSESATKRILHKNIFAYLIINTYNKST